MKQLVAGPFVGEFGWELFSWQGYLREISSEYDKIIISSRPTNKFLYQDFCHEFIPYDPKSFRCDCFKCDIGYPINDFEKKFPNSHYIVPDSHKNIEKFFPSLKQKFIKYVSDKKVDVVDIVINARMIDGNYYKTKRNWSLNKWVELVNILNDCGFSVASIGHSCSSICIDNTLNYLDRDLETISSLLSKCKLMVGQSSGPMHFASLCGCKHFVWTSNEVGDGINNKERYEKDWNPLNTEVFVYEHENWNPEVNDIIKNVKSFIGYNI